MSHDDKRRREKAAIDADTDFLNDLGRRHVDTYTTDDIVRLYGIALALQVESVQAPQSAERATVDAQIERVWPTPTQTWCPHVGGLGPPFTFCEICKNVNYPSERDVEVVTLPNGEQWAVAGPVGRYMKKLSAPSSERASITTRHLACPDPDQRCQHGDDMNCPALAPACKTCNGLGYVSVRQGGTHAPTDAPFERWTCNHDGTISKSESALSATSARKACPYCTSDNEAIRSTYYDQTCEGCVKRMGGHWPFPVDEKDRCK